MQQTPILDVLALKLQVTNTNFKKYISTLYQNQPDSVKKEEILSKLLTYKEEFGAILSESNELAMPSQELRDLQYQLFSFVLYANDLYTFYKEDLYDRFRLRIENHAQQERVNKLVFPN